ncbi:MAG TPA: Arc family DNA-binding protein, partial [Tepidisphaeraceae bacterium]|nr:Arc family DNA-binding protein [Tepidisphaeraceae bacterium]
MPQILVRNLDVRTRDQLKARARRNGRSMEEEVRHILHSAVAPSMPACEDRTLGDWIRNLVQKAGLRDEELAVFDELRGREMRNIPTFD